MPLISTVVRQTLPPVGLKSTAQTVLSARPRVPLGSRVGGNFAFATSAAKFILRPANYFLGVCARSRS
jgi:hypothetical protein